MIGNLVYLYLISPLRALLSELACIIHEVYEDL
jgi:hypothetical protein